MEMFILYNLTLEQMENCRGNITRAIECLEILNVAEKLQVLDRTDNVYTRRSYNTICYAIHNELILSLSRLLEKNGSSIKSVIKIIKNNVSASELETIQSDLREIPKLDSMMNFRDIFIAHSVPIYFNLNETRNIQINLSQVTQIIECASKILNDLNLLIDGSKIEYNEITNILRKSANNFWITFLLGLPKSEI
jgi:hypothetical protein